MLHGILLLFVLASPPADAALVRGAVRADSTGDPIAYATVEVVGTDWRVSADAGGYYILAGLPAGRWRIRASALGYAATQQDVDLGDGDAAQIDFSLHPEPVGLGALYVRAAPRTDAIAAPGSVRLAGETLRLVPALVEVDALRAAQITPSVTPVSDYSSALYVRGGAPDQTLVTLDGVPVFNPYHIGGLFGAFAGDAIESVDVLPGAMPARVGDRLSSVVNMRTRKGGRGGYHGRGAFGLMSSHAEVDGPLPGGNGSFLVSARQTYVGFTGGGFTAAGGQGGMLPQSITPEFRDFLLTATHDLGRYGGVDLLVFADHDWLSIGRTFSRHIRYRWGWGSRVAALTWRQPIGAAVVAETRVGYTGFVSGLSTRWRDATASNLVQTSRADGDMGDAFASLELTLHARRHLVHAGAQRDAYRMDYDSDRVDDPPEGLYEEYLPRLVVHESPSTTAAWIEDEWEPVAGLALRAGVRVLDAGRVGRVVGPRVAARVRLPAGFELSAGGGRYGQALHSIRNEEAVATNYMAYDLLRPAPVAVGVAEAEDAVASLSWQGGRTSVRVDAYTKRMDRLSVAPLPADPHGTAVLITDSILPASGRARGLELSVRHVRDRGGVWLSYAFLDTYREVDGIRYTPRFERRHMADLMAVVPVTEQIRISGRATFGTGQPYTPADGVMYDFLFVPGIGGISSTPASATTLLAPLNSARLPPYLRVDLGGRTHVERQIFGRRTELWPYVQLINVADIGNVASAKQYADGSRVSETHQLPLIITVGLEWAF
ncbi:MAG: TonB-dependent receptor [Gemmatimonadota bacterium]